MINNRQAGRRRGRGGQRSQGNPGRGPDNGSRIDNRARGNAAQLLEKYKSLASDAQRQGDRVNTEYYLQFADHYFRVLNENRARFEEQRPRAGNDMDDDDEFDGDMEAGDGDDRQDDGRSQRDDRGQREDRGQAERVNARDERGGYRDQQGERPRNDDRPRGDDRPRSDDRSARDDRPRNDDRGPRDDRSRGDGNPNRDARPPRADRFRDRAEARRDDRDGDGQRRPTSYNGQPANGHAETAGEGEQDRQPAFVGEAPMAEATGQNGETGGDLPRRRGRPRRDAAMPAVEGESFDAAILPPALNIEPSPAESGAEGDEPAPRRRGRPRRLPDVPTTI